MFKIALNKLYLTKGDTARFSISLDDRFSNGYVLSEADDIYFIVTELPEVVSIEDLGVMTDRYVFYKQGKDVVIDPEDTQELTNDKYYYQVRVVLGQSGDTNTIIEPEEFHITPTSRGI